MAALIKSLLIALLIGLTSCQSDQAPEKTRPKVVVTFTVLASMVETVAGDHVEVVSITKPGAAIHDYQPTPSDLRSAQGADLVFYNGLGLEAWFDKFLKQLGEVPSVTLSDPIEAMDIFGNQPVEYPNPHAWLSETESAQYIDQIVDGLVTLKPDAQSTFEQNAAQMKLEISEAFAAARAAAEALEPSQRWLATSEGAFSYLARDLGVNAVSLWPINADQQGTPRQVKAMIDTVREHNIPVIFSESTVSAEPAEQIARETGIRYGGVLYVDSLTTADGAAPTYLDLIKTTLTVIAAGWQAND